MSSKEALMNNILALRSRGEIKRFAMELSHDSVQLALYRTLMIENGHSLDMPVKKGLRLLLQRENESRRRTNPIHVDVAFDCIHCGRSVPVGGRMVRDHCPYCLSGRHVDIHPGDRAATCRAVLRPNSFEVRTDLVWIHYKCSECDHRFRVRSHPDDNIPYSLNVADLP